MKNTIVKVLTIVGGIMLALTAIAGVAYLLQKKVVGKGSKKYVSCPQDEADMLDELSEEDEICEDDTAEETAE